MENPFYSARGCYILCKGATGMDRFFSAFKNMVVSKIFHFNIMDGDFQAIIYINRSYFYKSTKLHFCPDKLTCNYFCNLTNEWVWFYFMLTEYMKLKPQRYYSIKLYPKKNICFINSIQSEELHFLG